LEVLETNVNMPLIAFLGDGLLIHWHGTYKAPTWSMEGISTAVKNSSCG